jgi:hypothetical protein
MAFDYVNIRENTVNPLFQKFGKAAQLSVNVPATGDPWDSQIDGEELHDVTVIQTTFEKEDNNGTLVQETDVLFLVSTEGVTVDPSLADRLIANGVTYQVVRIDPLQPGPTTMLWKLHGRK